MLARIEAGCPCIRVEPDSVRIEPGESRPMIVVFDPSGEPDFRGGMAVHLIGRDGRDAEIFKTTVTLHVGP